MKLLKSINLLLLLALGLHAECFEAIQSLRIDINQVQKIFMHPGRPTVLNLPCIIDYALPGTKSDIETKVGIKDRRSIAIWLKKSDADVVGLTVFCSKSVIAFEIIPSKYNHSAVLNIIGFKSNLKRRKKEILSKPTAYRKRVKELIR